MRSTLLLFAYVCCAAWWEAPAASQSADPCLGSLLNRWNFDSLRQIIRPSEADDYSHTLWKHDPYSWKACGGDPTILDLNVEIQPDPIRFPGNVSVTVTGHLNVNISHSHSLHVKLEYKLGGLVWVDVPCSYCNYDDFCDVLDDMPDCDYQCPLEPGEVKIEDQPQTVPELDVPPGEYRLTMRLMLGEDLVRCFQVIVNLRSE